MENVFLGKSITKFRVEKEMTQTDLSKSCGIPQPAISSYERGKATPEQRTLCRIADALNVTVDDILAESVKLRNEWAHGESLINLSEREPLSNEPVETYITDNVSVSFRVDVLDRNNRNKFRGNSITSIVERVLLDYIETNRDEIEELIANEVESSIGDVTRFLKELKNN